MTTRRIRALVIDDEPLARKRIRALLDAEPEIDVAGEAGSGTEAAALIRDVKPDLVFLDVQMPGMDGFSVLRALAPGAVPLVVFVTAYDDHAIRAFDVHAVDYVLKPVVAERFRAAVRRAIERLSSSSADVLSRQMASILERLPSGTGDRLTVRSGERTIFIRFDDIDWIDVEGDYARLHVGKDTHLLRETLTELEHRLPAPRFIRIHRSFIVQADRIQSVQPWFKGDYVLTLRDGTRLQSGRTYRQRVQDLIR
jgi:two-component system, LytTR family, response regulator